MTSGALAALLMAEMPRVNLTVGASTALLPSEISIPTPAVMPRSTALSWNAEPPCARELQSFAPDELPVVNAMRHPSLKPMLAPTTNVGTIGNLDTGNPTRRSNGTST
jgi:hypothetical protein